MFGLPLISGCSNDDDGTWCSDPAFVQDSEGRWVFGPVCSVGCRHFMEYAVNHEWQQVSVTTLNSKGEEVAIPDPSAYGDPLHILITPNSIIDLGSSSTGGVTYQYDIYHQPIPEGVLIETWDPLNACVDVIGERWHPGKLELDKVGDNIFPTEMSLIDYYPRLCIRRMKPIL